MSGCYGYDDRQGGPCQATATERTPGGQHLCGSCAEQFWATRQKIDRDYPDSDCPPAWFDPSFAGERWDADY